MKWGNVNFRDHVLTYEQQKTGKVVPVPIVDDLYDHLHTMREFVDCDYICPELAARGSGGKHGLSDSFVRIVKRAKIDPQQVQGKGKRKFTRLSFHSLRHSFNSALANAGVSQELRMKLTDHSSVGMNDRYNHHTMKPLEQAMSVLPSFNEEPQHPAQTSNQPQAAPVSQPPAKGNAAKQSSAEAALRSSPGPQNDNELEDD